MLTEVQVIAAMRKVTDDAVAGPRALISIRDRQMPTGTPVSLFSTQKEDIN